MLYTLQFRSIRNNLNNTKICKICSKTRRLILFWKVKNFYSENYTTHKYRPLKREIPAPNFMEVYYTVKYLKARDTDIIKARQDYVLRPGKSRLKVESIIHKPDGTHTVYRSFVYTVHSVHYNSISTILTKKCTHVLCIVVKFT